MQRTMVKEVMDARVVGDKQLLKSLVVHAALVFPLGKACLNALFTAKQRSNQGRHANST